MKKLGHLASIRAGYPFRGKITEATGSSVVVVQMRDVSRTCGVGCDVDWSRCLPVSPHKLRDHDGLRSGDILVAARGSHVYSVAVPPSLETSGLQAVASPHFFLVRLHSDALLPEFVAWFLNQPPAQRHFERYEEGSVAKSIRRSVLEDVLIVIPPLEKQRALMALANTLREEQTLLEQLIRNNDRTMRALANDLVRADTPSEPAFAPDN